MTAADGGSLADAGHTTEPAPAPEHQAKSEAGDPAAGHGSGHGQEEMGEPLGPIDVLAWGYALAGAAIGLVTAGALVAAST